METCNTRNQNRVKMNFPSLQNLVDNRVFSHIMAWKIVGRGLKFHHFELAHQRKPDENHVLFTEEHVGTDYETLQEMTVPEKNCCNPLIKPSI